MPCCSIVKVRVIVSSEDMKYFVVKGKWHSLGHCKGLTVVFIKYQMENVQVYNLHNILMENLGTLNKPSFG